MEYQISFTTISDTSNLDEFLHVWWLIRARLRFVLVQELWSLREVEDHVEGGGEPVGKVLRQERTIDIEIVGVVGPNFLQDLRYDVGFQKGLCQLG